MTEQTKIAAKPQSVTEQTKIAAKPQSVTEQTKIAAKPQSVTEQTKIAAKPREKLVDKGLQFWTTKGTKMSAEEKIKYLKSKGLTESEIFIVKTNGENELYKLKIQGMMDNPETYYKQVDGANGGQNSTKNIVVTSTIISIDTINIIISDFPGYYFKIVYSNF